MERLRLDVTDAHESSGPAGENRNAWNCLGEHFATRGQWPPTLTGSTRTRSSPEAVSSEARRSGVYGTTGTSPEVNSFTEDQERSSLHSVALPTRTTRWLRRILYSTQRSGGGTPRAHRDREPDG
jgi:hypothetical protein